MFKKVAFTMYPVTEMARARAFYEQTLGLPPSRNSEKSPWVEFDLPGGGCLAITNVSRSQPSASAGGMIALEVEDLDGLVADLRAKGVEIAGEGIEGPGCHMAVVKDPDGNALILHKLKQDA
jgi:predicted enzyme related to lactoylglutathione lyase